MAIAAAIEDEALLQRSQTVVVVAKEDTATARRMINIDIMGTRERFEAPRRMSDLRIAVVRERIPTTPEMVRYRGVA